MNLATKTEHLDREGFVIVPSVFNHSECCKLRDQIKQSFRENNQKSEAIASSQGAIFAARNVIDTLPRLSEWWQRSPLLNFLHAVLGEEVGLVRGLFFDKPSHRSWSLPFHKDMTIAVKDNGISSERFCKPTHKAGVPHVEAPCEILEQMLTIRIHLDDVSDQNEPLQVIPGSHQNGKTAGVHAGVPQVITCKAGDVLAMRPLISHASGHSDPDAGLHRSILHLEFSGVRSLPDGYAWYWYITEGG